MKVIPLLLLLLTFVGTIQAADSFPIQVCPCPKTGSAPMLDGKLDDAVWQDAPVAAGFTVFKFDPKFDDTTPADPPIPPVNSPLPAATSMASEWP